MENDNDEPKIKSVIENKRATNVFGFSLTKETPFFVNAEAFSIFTIYQEKNNKYF